MSRRFDVEDWLDSRLGVDNRSDGGSGVELVLDCPVCGASRKLYVNAKSGLWICYRCGEKGNATRLVAEVEGVSFSEARRFVLRGAMERPSKSVSEIRNLERGEIRDSAQARGVQLPDEFVPIFDSASKQWRIPTYLRDRGIDPSVAAIYGLGYCERGRYAGRLVLPAHVLGEVRTFQARAMGDFLPKYLGPRADKKSGVLFGLDEAFGSEEIVVVEGPLDVLSLAGRGITAVGLMGKVASPAQATLLAKAGFRRAVVMLDADARKDAGAVAMILGGVLESVKIASLPDGLDPDEAPIEVVEKAISEAREPTIRDRVSGGL